MAIAPIWNSSTEMKPAAKQEMIEWRNTDAWAPAVVVVVDMVVSPKPAPGGQAVIT